jgi:myo-inositol-1(or 4)-monophosphatase
MHPLLNIGVRAARRAGDIIIRHINQLDAIKVDSKGRNDFVTEVDRMAEQDIIETVRRSYPDHAFLAEESGSSGDAEFVWIIDPLDGTTNFLHGFPVFAVSIAVMQRGRLEHGVIYDPMRQELFTTSRGTGATVDGRRMRVSDTRLLSKALVGTGFPFRSHPETGSTPTWACCAPRWSKPPTCAGRAPPPSTWPTSPRAGWTVSGKSA